MSMDLKEVKALREETGLGFMDCKRALEEAEGDREQAIVVLRKKGMAAAERRTHRSADQGVIGLYISPDRTKGGMVELRCETDFVARSDDFRKLALGLAELVAEAETGPTGLEGLRERPAGPGKGTVADEIQAVGGRVGEKVVLHRVTSLPPSKSDYHRLGGYAHHNGKCGSLVRVSFQEGGTAEKVDGVLKDLAMHVAAYVPSPLAVSRDDIPQDVLAKEKAIQADTDEIRNKPEKIRDKILQGKMQKFIKELVLLEQPLVTVTDSKVAVGEVLKRKSKDLSDSLTVEGFLRFQLGED